MGPLTCLSLDFFLDVPNSSNHIHGIEKPIDPLALRDVLSSPNPFKKGYVLLRFLSFLISVGQFKFSDGIEAHLYELIFLLLIMNIQAMSLPTSCRGLINHVINGLKSLIHGEILLHLDQECLHWSSTIKLWGIRKFRPYPSQFLCDSGAPPC
jgi:hypothetical protein